MTLGSTGVFHKVLLFLALTECSALAAQSHLPQGDNAVRGLYHSSKGNAGGSDPLLSPFNGSGSFPVARPTNTSKSNHASSFGDDVECDGESYGQVLWQSCHGAAETIPYPSPTLRRMTFAYRDYQSHRMKWGLLLPRRFLSSESGSQVISTSMEPH